jgi:hypothetical protein
MSAVIVDTILVFHVVFALVWLGAMIAGIFPALRLIRAQATDPSRDDPAIFRRGIVLSRIIAGAGGVAVVFGLALYYYINFVDMAFATSASGLPLIGTGAALGLIAFILSTYQSPKLRRGYKYRIQQASTAAGIPGQASPNVSQTTRNQLPPRYLILITPVILLLALVLMVIGSSI